MTMLPDAEERPAITVGEAAKILNVSRSSAYIAARTGELPTIRIGRRVLVPTAALRRMLAVDQPQPAA